jgi:predicted PolB exonuclease-like 3'-5' exonuclease
MKKFYFDIETIPADESSHEVLKYLYERKVKKAKDKDPNKEIESLEQFIENTAFDGSFGRVLCISYAVNDDETRTICNLSADEAGERKVLEDFWFVAKQIDLFVGHNIMEFDLRFLLQRSMVLGVKPTWNRFESKGLSKYKIDQFLSFARYSNYPIFDTMQEWSNWGNQKLGLEHVALALGIPTPKGEGIDGSEVYNFYKAGKVKEICNYCERDVETTRAVYKRMTFDNAVNLASPF